jgi:UDP-N-acetylmuramoyl-tripeptide--D-alanyl-D-alanine ligase
MSALWTSAELRAATGGTLAEEVIATGVSIDTRTIQPGDIFVALRDARDGHDFAAQAFAKGASCALVDRAVEGGPNLLVRDTLEGLAALGAAGRARGAARVIAVTGSVGKTTTKEMLRRACQGLGATHASAASHNNHWGVPLTLARMPRGTEWAAVEIGMNHRHEIAPLSRFARPHVTIVTAIGTAHIGNLGSQEAIADEKADISAGIEAGGIALLPADSPFFARMKSVAEGYGAKVTGFGENAGECRLLSFEGTAEGSRVTADVFGTRIEAELAQPGKHMAMNALAALSAVAAAGGDVSRAAAALSGFGAGAGRGERRQVPLPRGGSFLLLDESYNASDSAVRAALGVLAAQPARRRVAILGDMLELGDFGADLHRALAPDVAAAADIVYGCGPLTGAMMAALPAGKRGAHALDAASLLPALRDALRDGDAVLVKGSLNMRMATIVRGLSEPEKVP